MSDTRQSQQVADSLLKKYRESRAIQLEKQDIINFLNDQDGTSSAGETLIMRWKNSGRDLGLIAEVLPQIEEKQERKENLSSAELTLKGLLYILQYEYKAAQQTFEQAEMLGNATAANLLGNMYSRGLIHQKPDFNKAEIHYNRAASKGSILGICNYASTKRKNNQTWYLSPEQIQILTQASDQGNPYASYQLGVHYFTRFDNEISCFDSEYVDDDKAQRNILNDFDQSHHYFKKAIHQGYGDTLHEFANAFSLRHEIIAIKLYEELAHHNDLEALDYLGHIHLKNKEFANSADYFHRLYTLSYSSTAKESLFDLLKKSAENSTSEETLALYERFFSDIPDAQNKLFELAKSLLESKKEDPLSLRSDFEKTEKFLIFCLNLKPHDSEMCKMINLLARYYTDKLYDTEKSKELCNLSAEHEHYEGINWLAQYYTNGIPIAEQTQLQSKEKAISLLVPFADKNSKIAYQVGHWYKEEKDYSKAKEYYLKAAAQKNAQAFIELGEIGEEIEKNYNEAAQFYQQAAKLTNRYNRTLSRHNNFLDPAVQHLITLCNKCCRSRNCYQQYPDVIYHAAIAVFSETNSTTNISLFRPMRKKLSLLCQNNYQDFQRLLIDDIHYYANKDLISVHQFLNSRRAQLGNQLIINILIAQHQNKLAPQVEIKLEQEDIQNEAITPTELLKRGIQQQYLIGNWDLAEFYYRRAIETSKGNIHSADKELGFLAIIYEEMGNPKKAIELYTFLFEQGRYHQLGEIADNYYYRHQYETAKYLYELLMTKNCFWGASKLGFMYENAIGTERNLSKAAKYYRRAVILNEDSARRKLLHLFRKHRKSGEHPDIVYHFLMAALLGSFIDQDIKKYITKKSFIHYISQKFEKLILKINLKGLQQYLAEEEIVTLFQLSKIHHLNKNLSVAMLHIIDNYNFSTLDGQSLCKLFEHAKDARDNEYITKAILKVIEQYPFASLDSQSLFKLLEQVQDDNNNELITKVIFKIIEEYPFASLDKDMLLKIKDIPFNDAKIKQLIENFIDDLLRKYRLTPSTLPHLPLDLLDVINSYSEPQHTPPKQNPIDIAIQHLDQIIPQIMTDSGRTHEGMKKLIATLERMDTALNELHDIFSSKPEKEDKNQTEDKIKNYLEDLQNPISELKQIYTSPSFKFSPSLSSETLKKIVESVEEAIKFISHEAGPEINIISRLT